MAAANFAGDSPRQNTSVIANESGKSNIASKRPSSHVRAMEPGLPSSNSPSFQPGTVALKSFQNSIGRCFTASRRRPSGLAIRKPPPGGIEEIREHFRLLGGEIRQAVHVVHRQLLGVVEVLDAAATV